MDAETIKINRPRRKGTLLNSSAQALTLKNEARTVRASDEVGCNGFDEQ